MKPIKAWHFMRADRKLGYGDERVAVKGRTLRVDGKPVMCSHGLHGSRRIVDALSYACGPVVCRVEIGGDIIEQDDKLVGNIRKTLWWIDGTILLREFACRVAEDALRVADVKDERCWNAIRVARQWMKGETTDEELAVAKDAAWDAAADAAGVVARAAAWDAARVAARDAAAARVVAWAVARAAAWDAARVAARDAARAAAWDAASAAAWDAASAAAWDAARVAASAAARAAQNRRLTAMVCAANHNAVLGA